MKTTNVILALALTASPLAAQQMRSATWSTDRFLLRYRTMLEPPRPGSPELSIGGGGSDDFSTNHRVLTDVHQKRFFGYDLHVEALPANGFSLTFKPLTLAPDRMHFFNIDNTWTQIQLPDYPASLQLADGETAALDLLINPSTGQKIVEYITVTAPTKRSTLTAASHDLQLNDIHMTLASPRLRIDGKPYEWNGGDAHGSASGPTVWIYIPGRGRFLFTYQPRGGYRRVGEVRGKSIAFTWNNETFEVQSTGNVLPGEGVFNLYVAADPGYHPGPAPAQYGAVSQE